MTAITKQEIQSKCSAALIASRDCQAIAAAVNVGRTRPSATEVGNGTIITVLNDLDVANAFLEMLHTDARFKYVVPLLDQGRLLIGAVFVQAAIQGFVPQLLTQAQANALLALGVEPDPISPSDVASVLFNTDGSAK